VELCIRVFSVHVICTAQLLLRAVENTGVVASVLSVVCQNEVSVVEHVVLIMKCIAENLV